MLGITGLCEHIQKFQLERLMRLSMISFETGEADVLELLV